MQNIFLDLVERAATIVTIQVARYYKVVNLKVYTANNVQTMKLQISEREIHFMQELNFE